MSSFDILSQETTLPQRLFLEASAGTGKTFTIEHLVIRLLIETSTVLEQILVVTFTRAATRELKERIRKTLQQVIQGQADFDYLKELTPEQLEKIKTAFLTFEKAQIFTIHGFCQRILQEFAFEASVGLKMSEWSSEEEEWAILEFLRKTTAISPQQLKRLLGKYQNDIKTVVEKLKRSTPSQESSFSEILTLINGQLSQIPSFPLVEMFAEIRSQYKGMTSVKFEAQAQRLQEVLERKELRACKEITPQFGLCETKPNRNECNSHPKEEHHSQFGKGDEEDRLGKVAASPNREVISLQALRVGFLPEDR